MPSPYKYCPSCATPLQLLAQMEDGGEKQRLRCPNPACGWTHWNNPTPVLAAVIEYRARSCWRATRRGRAACLR
jgi:NAD+ diphosphatase